MINSVETLLLLKLTLASPSNVLINLKLIVEMFKRYITKNVKKKFVVENHGRKVLQSFPE